MATMTTTTTDSPPTESPRVTEKDDIPRRGPRITRRTEKSTLTKLLHVILRPLKPRLVLPKLHHHSGSQKLEPPKKVSRRCHVNERQIDGIWVYDITSKTAEDETKKKSGTSTNGTAVAAAAESGLREGGKKRMVYFAGGGWQMKPSVGHWALMAELASKVPNLTATLVSYPLAPKSPAAISMPQLEKMYHSIMNEALLNGEKIIFAGDSSGGNIALCLVLWQLSETAVQTELGVASRPPAAVLGICPSTDLRHLDKKLHNLARLDPLLTVPFITSTAQAWSAGGSADKEGTGVTEQADINTSTEIAWSTSDPRVSPILADLTPLVKHGVKLHGVTGTYDILSFEANLFRDKCVEVGVEGEWLEWEGQMHCFPLAFSYGLQESKEAVYWVADVLRGI